MILKAKLNNLENGFSIHISTEDVEMMSRDLRRSL
jgi:hypothetical protein